jgi:two-component system sensor histidine kinase KdpD
MAPPPSGHTDRLLACLQMGLGHELANRLTALQGLLRVLEAEAGDRHTAEQRDYLRRAVSLARRSHALAGDLAQLVRAARASPAPANLDLGEAVREAAAEVKQLDPAAAIDYHVLTDIPQVKLSPLLLRPILVRLVRALVQLAGTARPLRVEVGAARAGGEVRLWLRDDGPGWPPERLAPAFEPFVGAPASEADTGLGLYPVRHLVEGWGGTVAVQSEPGQGTTFTISWKDEG